MSSSRFGGPGHPRQHATDAAASLCRRRSRRPPLHVSVPRRVNPTHFSIRVCERCARVKIADAAKRINDLPDAWLNPRDLVKRVPEVVPGFPDRILPVDDKAAAVLNKRTLTNLYNERPAWLVNAHRDLDNAVAAAYGWPADISEDDALARLFALNQSRAHVADQRRAR
jgi:hypothetical protein